MFTYDRNRYIKFILNQQNKQKNFGTKLFHQREVKIQEIVSQDDTKDPHEMKLIFMTWINLWCATFKY